MTTETWLLILNFVLGGGLITAIVSIFTLRSQVKEAEAKAEQALAEADGIILGVPHKEYLELQPSVPFVDCWGIWS